VSDDDFLEKRPTTRLVQCRGPLEKTSLWPVSANGTQRFMSAKSAVRYFPVLAGVVDVAMTCHVPPLRDHTCRL
jgi:hypothetical protein